MPVGLANIDRYNKIYAYLYGLKPNAPVSTVRQLTARSAMRLNPLSALLADLVFPAKANNVDDEALIANYQRMRSGNFETGAAPTSMYKVAAQKYEPLPDIDEEKMIRQYQSQKRHFYGEE